LIGSRRELRRHRPQANRVDRVYFRRPEASSRLYAQAKERPPTTSGLNMWGARSTAWS
jgi:hypothetical protein